MVVILPMLTSAAEANKVVIFGELHAVWRASLRLT